MQTLYTRLKVNNEIELCEVRDGVCKKDIEKELLQNRISYFIRWPKPRLFGRKDLCIFCVNESSKEEASEIIQNICDTQGYPVRFLFKRSKNNFL